MEKRDGEYIAYYRNGQIKERCLYRDGKLVGPFVTADTREAGRSAESSFASREEEEDFEEPDEEDMGPYFSKN